METSRRGTDADTGRISIGEWKRICNRKAPRPVDRTVALESDPPGRSLRRLSRLTAAGLAILSSATILTVAVLAQHYL
jgi:hypothetical protein